MCKACYPEIYEFDRKLDDPYAEVYHESGLLESEFEGGWSGEDPPRGRVIIGKGNPEFQMVLDAIRSGNRNRNSLTDLVFFSRFPCLKGIKLNTLPGEWKSILPLVDAALSVPVSF